MDMDKDVHNLLSLKSHKKLLTSFQSAFQAIKTVQ